MTYRSRLLVAFAYVLVLVIVALAVPLALSTQHRIDREVRAQAADGAQLVAASASGRLDQPRQLDTLVGKVARDLGARVIVVGPHGPLLADSAQPGTRGVAYGSRPEIASALAGRTVQGRRRSRDAGRAPALHGGAGRRGRPHGRRGARHAERLGLDREMRRDQYALLGVGALALAFGMLVTWFVAGSLARPLGSSPRPPVASAPATLRHARRWRVRPSSKRSRVPSTRWPTGSPTRSRRSASSWPTPRISCARR